MSSTFEHTDIRDSIKKLRQMVGLSQKELAEKANLSIATIQGYEQKKFSPKADSITKIMKVFLKYAADPDVTIEIHTIRDQIAESVIAESKATGKEVPEESKHIVASLIAATEAAMQDYFLAQIIDSYRRLNSDGQVEAAERVEELTYIPKYRIDSPPDWSGIPQDPATESSMFNAAENESGGTPHDPDPSDSQ